MRISVLDKIFNLLDRAAHWGVHPDYHKEPAASRLIGKMPLPPYLYLPLVQHSGAPARAVVKVGDAVLAGQLLAEAGGTISAPVHAPAAGIVEAIGPRIAPHPSGLPVETITLRVTGSEHIDTEFNTTSLEDLRILLYEKLNTVDGILEVDTSILMGYEKRDYTWGTGLDNHEVGPA